jgi:hypothetical protein
MELEPFAAVAASRLALVAGLVVDLAEVAMWYEC